MGTSTSFSYGCACRKTRLMGPAKDIWIEWQVCAEHYKPEVDDKMIVEAAKNYRDDYERNKQAAEADTLRRIKT